jgi:hypothetical protein
MFLLYFTTISTMSSYKGESETSETEHLHGNKASCDEETYTVTHIQVKIVMKRRNQT